MEAHDDDSCGAGWHRSGGTGAAKPGAEDALRDLSKRWLDGSMRENPVNATLLGDHRFDGEVDDMSAADARRLAFNEKVLKELEAIDTRQARARTRSMPRSCATICATRYGPSAVTNVGMESARFNDPAGNAMYGLTVRDYAPCRAARRGAARMEKIAALLAQGAC
jgi:uncharacterized protein (DUF885 family)